MSQATAEQAEKNAGPDPATRRGQLGPDIQGSGTINFRTNGQTLYLLISPRGDARALWGVDGQRPSQPLEPLVWTPFRGVDRVDVDYAANGGDLKLVWAQ